MQIVNRGNLAWRYGLGILGLRSNDIWFAAYPKSGSSWFRLILWNIISLTDLNASEVDYRTLDEMPALGFSNLLKSWEYKTLPRFIKTHRPYNATFFSKPERAILLIRDPRDTLVSYYHMAQKTKAPSGRFEGEFGEFIRHPKFGLESWMKHFSSWRSKADVILTYEALRRDVVPELLNTFQNLNISVPPTIIESAAERSGFEQMQKAEAKYGLSGSNRFDANFKFVRSGKSKQWHDYFSDADLAYYRKMHSKYKIDLYLDAVTS